MNENENIVRDFEEKGLRDQNISQLVTYLTAKFELYLDQHCMHLNEKAAKLQLKKVQNTSAVLFFLMIQVPLSQFSSAFCFLTAFLFWLIDYKTKQDIYNCL